MTDSKEKIQALTPEQEALLSVYADRWTDIGLSTAPSKRAESEAAIRNLYKSAQLGIPAFLWVGSLFSAELVANQVNDQRLINMLHDLDLSSREVAMKAFEEAASKMFTDNYKKLNLKVEDVEEDFAEIFSGKNPNKLSSKTHIEEKALKHSWYLAARFMIEKLVETKGKHPEFQKKTVSKDVRYTYYTQLDGQYDANSTAFYAYFNEVLDVEYPDRWVDWKTVVESTSWWIALDGLCICSERPEAIHRDEEGRLHCETTMAYECRDGIGTYNWHGVVLNACPHVITAPETISLEEIKTEDNEEVRRIMIERYGTGKYLTDIGASVVDVDIDEDGIERALLKAKDGAQYLSCACTTTGRIYHLEVSEDVKTCPEAAVYLQDDATMEIVGQS